MHSRHFLLTCFIAFCPSAFALPLSKLREVPLPRFHHPTVVKGPSAPAPVNYTDSVEVASLHATQHVLATTGCDQREVQLVDRHTSHIHHIYFTQLYNGIPIANAASNVNVDSTGAIVSVYHCFASSNMTRTAAPIVKRDAEMMKPDQALLMFAAAKGLSVADKLVTVQLGDTYEIHGASFTLQPVIAAQKYYQTKEKLVHTWDLQVRTKADWLNVFVDSATGAIVGSSSWTFKFGATASSGSTGITQPSINVPAKGNVVDIIPQFLPVSDFSNGPVPAPQPLVAKMEVAIRPARYRVVPIGARNPVTNHGLTTVKNPWDTAASPQGWHASNNDLSGNNVYAQSNKQNKQQPDEMKALSRPSSGNLDFGYFYSGSHGAENLENVQAAVTNAFYVSNMFHDILWNYGFTEEAGNFQNSNFGRGGVEGDAVIANTESGSGTDNASFMSPPDGQNGIMSLYVFDYASPPRDAALENDVPFHEMAHGLSQRLTGGPSNGNCLAGGVHAGLGEGWSDTFAYLVSMPATQTRNNDFAMGTWILNSAQGARAYPYSTDLNRNPRLYSDLAKTTEIHQIGEVWAVMLYEILWNMVDRSGFTPPALIMSSAGSGSGNTDLMLLLVAAMKLQPCSPTFIQARDAIILADKTMFHGKYECDLWAGFGRRGMGVNAKDDTQYQNDFYLPGTCASKN
ncbi:Fungalysin metallopeptidase-domain-containing protein [Chytriomyces sp. MP71]|nr:Fungalysin metallopeptidase-domain-containing protein [Chytriomyces sp. MP71]